MGRRPGIPFGRQDKTQRDFPIMLQCVACGADADPDRAAPDQCEHCGCLHFEIIPPRKLMSGEGKRPLSSIAMEPWKLSTEDLKVIAENAHRIAAPGVPVKEADASVIRRAALG